MKENWQLILSNWNINSSFTSSLCPLNADEWLVFILNKFCPIFAKVFKVLLEYGSVISPYIPRSTNLSVLETIITQSHYNNASRSSLTHFKLSLIWNKDSTFICTTYTLLVQEPHLRVCTETSFLRISYQRNWGLLVQWNSLTPLTEVQLMFTVLKTYLYISQRNAYKQTNNHVLKDLQVFCSVIKSYNQHRLLHAFQGYRCKSFREAVFQGFALRQ